MLSPRFSIKALLLLVSALCICLAWWVIISKSQQRVAQFVLSKHGDVAYSYNRRPNNQPPPPPAWMMRPAYRDYFFPVVGIGIRDEADLTESDLHVLRSFPEVGDLHLEGPHFTDRAVDYILQLKHLRCLNLVNTAITDKGLASLADIASLKEVGLFNNAVTIDGVQALQQALPDCTIRR